MSNVATTILMRLKDKINSKATAVLTRSEKQLVMMLIDTFTYIAYQLLFVDWFWDEKKHTDSKSRIKP